MNDLLAQLEESQRRFEAALRLVTDEGANQLKALASKLSEESNKLSQFEARLAQRTEARVDVARVTRKALEADFGALDSRESSFLATEFLRFDAGIVSRFLRYRPEYHRRFLRSLLARTSEAYSTTLAARWDDYARIAELLDKDSWPIGVLPISRSRLVLRGGVGELVERWGPRSLAELLATLSQARVRPWWGVTTFSVVEWLRRRTAQRTDCTDGLETVFQNARLTSVLLPLTGGPPAGESSIAFIASLLRARMARLLKDDSFQELQARLFAPESTYKDPRVERPGSPWEAVRAREASAFDRFLQELIREDLSFFFDHSMKDAARGDFWLRYLGSIRRTRCYLDPASHRELGRRVAAMSGDLRVAFRRAQCFREGTTSAFCLYFDQFVLVEFSEKGFAATLFDRSTFDSLIKQAPNRADDLRGQKVPQLESWRHRPLWEGRFAEKLMARGIHPQSPRRSR